MSVNQATIDQEELQWNQMPNNWSQTVKLDYQNKTSGLSDVAVVANEANVTANAEADKNANQDKAIELNRQSIIDALSKVSVLSQRITKNTAEILENKQDIETNTENLKTHEDLNSAHGVTGNNVGTEDYAKELVGGVVLIAANLSELTHSFSSLTAAPASYNQSYMQSVANAVNSLGNQQGDIITLLNEVLRGQKDAKQMQSDTPLGDNYLPFRFFFGKGWTIATINHGKIGREIHVQSSVPLRKISTEIMDGFNCDWFTTISPSNQKAINLAIKTGFKLFGVVELSDASSGSKVNMNTYKRVKI